MNEFTIKSADSFIWNSNELLQFLVINQGNDILIDTYGEGCCARANGLYDLLDLFNFRTVTICTNNILETHHTYKIIGDNYFRFFDLEKTNYTNYHNWNKSNIFGVFYNRPLWHRIGLACELYEYNTLLNFRSDPHCEDNRPLFELQKLFEVHPESAHKFLNLIDKFPKQLEKVDGYTAGVLTNQHTDQLCQFYPNIFLDIVAETFVNGNTFFATEKTVRPILLKKPFIIMGSKNFLIYLRQMGFKTFCEYWDEDYDGYEGKDRYIRILEVIKSIATKSPQELEAMYKSMQSILTYNYVLLINKAYNKNIRNVE